jgi:probable addiction module antidote protein
MNIDKLRKNTIPYNELEKKYMEDYEYQKEYLNLSLEEYIADGDFNKFYKSLEKVIKSRESISSFAKKVNIDRSNLYTLFNGEKVPRLDTIAKILKELGYTIKVA